MIQSLELRERYIYIIIFIIIFYCNFVKFIIYVIIYNQSLPKPGVLRNHSPNGTEETSFKNRSSNLHNLNFLILDKKLYIINTPEKVFCYLVTIEITLHFYPKSIQSNSIFYYTYKNNNNKNKLSIIQILLHKYKGIVLQCYIHKNTELINIVPLIFNGILCMHR